jgi:hypothetical protein
MTQTSTTPAGRTSRRTAVDHGVAVLATGSAGILYLLSRGADVDLAVRGAQGTFRVGLVGVLVTAAVVSVAGLGLLRFLESRGTHALRTWTSIACLVWLGSFVGPLGAADLASGLALAGLHVVVGTAVVVGALGTRLRGVA